MGGGGGASHFASPSFSSGGRSFSANSFSNGGRSFGNQGARSFNSGNARWNGGENFARGNFNANGNWNRGNWNGRNWYGYNNGWNRGGFWWGVGPYWWPAWGVSLGYPYGYSDYDDYPYYQTGYAPAATAEPATVAAPAEQSNYASSGGEFFSQAEQAFASGDYHNALRMANHAAVDSPQNPRAHELMSLSLFALKDYRGAALEAHAALSLGPPADWSELYSYYGNLDTYTAQLRDLEKYSQDNPDSAGAHFLRAYQYLMTGNKDAFHSQMALASKLAPKDKLSAELLKDNGELSAPASAPTPPPKAPNGAQENTTPAPTGSLTGVDS
jgi:HEPN domain-containing protein